MDNKLRKKINNHKMNQFGIEIEMTGMTRKNAAVILANFFGTKYGMHQDKLGHSQFEVPDNDGRVWLITRDVTLTDLTGGNDHSVEITSPILTLKDIPIIKQITPLLKENGGIANKSCGFHVHIDSSMHSPKSIRNMLNIFYDNQEMLYHTLDVYLKRMIFCKPFYGDFIGIINNINPIRENDLKDIWLGSFECSDNANWRGININNLWKSENKTLEFRIFNGTLDENKIEANIKFCLALSKYALISSCKPVTLNDSSKYTIVNKDFEKLSFKRSVDLFQLSNQSLLESGIVNKEKYSKTQMQTWLQELDLDQKSIVELTKNLQDNKPSNDRKIRLPESIAI